jgi:beta-mannosidase
VWWLNDLRMGAGFGLVDADARPKAPYWAFARLLAPVAVWITDEGTNGLDVHVANDTAEAIAGDLAVRLFARGEVAVGEAARAIEVPARSTVRFGVEELLGRFVDAAYAYRFGPPGHDVVAAVLTAGDLVVRDVHFPLGPPAERAATTVDAVAATVGPAERDGAVAVQVTARRLVYGLHVEAAGFTAATDDLVLEPGGVAVVELDPDGPAAGWTGGTVGATNLEGVAPIVGAVR